MRATFQVTNDARKISQMKVSRSVHKLIGRLDCKQDVKASNCYIIKTPRQLTIQKWIGQRITLITMIFDVNLKRSIHRGSRLKTHQGDQICSILVLMKKNTIGIRMNLKTQEIMLTTRIFYLKQGLKLLFKLFLWPLDQNQ